MGLRDRKHGCPPARNWRSVKLLLVAAAVLLASPLCSAQDEADFVCEDAGTYLKFLSPTENVIYWPVDACGKAGNPQFLLETQRVSEWEGLVTIKYFHTQGVTAAGGAETNCFKQAETFDEVTECIPDAPAETHNVLLPQELPMVLERQNLTIGPYHADAKYKLESPVPVEELDKCTVLVLKCETCIVENLYLDVARCSSKSSPTVLSDSPLMHAALVVSTPICDSLTITNAHVYGGDWALVLTSIMDKTRRDFSRMDAAQFKKATVDIEHTASHSITPPGYVYAAAIDTLNITFVKSAAGRMTQNTVWVHRTRPQIFENKVRVYPRDAIKVRDISPYPFTTIHAREVTNFIQLHEIMEGINDLMLKGETIGRQLELRDENTVKSKPSAVWVIVASVWTGVAMLFAIVALISTHHVDHVHRNADPAHTQAVNEATERKHTLSSLFHKRTYSPEAQDLS
jgi:hypothetical protein